MSDDLVEVKVISFNPVGVGTADVTGANDTDAWVIVAKIDDQEGPQWATLRPLNDPLMMSLIAANTSKTSLQVRLSDFHERVRAGSHEPIDGPCENLPEPHE